MQHYVKALTILIVLLLCGCDFEFPGADEKFGRQNFVSAVSIIELHKLRNGEYPENLKELEFLGDWDGIWLSAVRYERSGNGYNLYLERGWIGTPALEFPEKFKQGLGIENTNLKMAKQVNMSSRTNTCLVAPLVLIICTLSPPWVYQFCIGKTIGEAANISEGIALLGISLLSILGVIWFTIGLLIFKKLLIRNFIIYSAVLTLIGAIYGLNLSS